MSRSRNICAKFQAALYEEDGKYTKYLFKIQTTFTQWKIEKRYSDFERLHKELIKFKQEETLPELPSKIFWNKNSQLNVTKRSFDLEKYLNELINSKVFFPKAPLLDFIEMTEEVLCLFKKTQSYFDSELNRHLLNASFNSELSYQSTKAMSVYNYNNSDYYGSDDNNLYYNIFQFNQRKALNDKGVLLVIEEFLRDLEQYKEKQGEIVKTFSKFYIEHSKDHQYSKKEIMMLFTGVKQNNNKKNRKVNTNTTTTFDSDEDDGNVNGNGTVNEDNGCYKGLLYHIGNYTENIVGSSACLDFLLQLLSCNKNFDYDKYINVLKSLDNKYLKMIKLNELTKARQTSIRKGGYNLFGILLNFQFEIEKLFNYNDYISLIEAISDKEIYEQCL